MRLNLRVLGAGLFFALACASPAHAGSCLRSTPPQLVDPFSGILDRQLIAPQALAPITEPRQLNAAVILSQNTKDQIAWSKKVMAGITGFDRFMTTMFVGSQVADNADRLCEIAYDPKFVTDSVMQPLVRRFRTVKVISDISEFASGPYDVLILIDVSFADIFTDGFFIGAKYQSGTTINAYFIDKTYALAGKVEATQTKKVRRNVYLKEVAALRGETLAQFEAGIHNLLGPEPTLTAAPPASAADRLRAVESLLQQGLITPEEAAQKKAEILKSL